MERIIAKILKGQAHPGDVMVSSQGATVVISDITTHFKVLFGPQMQDWEYVDQEDKESISPVASQV